MVPITVVAVNPSTQPLVAEGLSRLRGDAHDPFLEELAHGDVRRLTRLDVRIARLATFEVIRLQIQIKKATTGQIGNFPA